MSVYDKEVRSDLDCIQVALEHALTYPSKAGKVMDQAAYHAAHVELQQGLTSIKRLRRVFNGARVKSSTSRTNSNNHFD